MLLSIAALVLLILRAMDHKEVAHLVAALLMGISLILEFLFSTLYHALVPKRAKSVFRILDHSAIYLLIAGSNAPFELITLADRGGLQLTFLIWGIAIAGVIAEVLLKERQPHWLSALIYLAMGWFIVFRITDLYELLPPPAFMLLVAGGICYTIGVGFYVAKKVPYLHFIWHLWVLAGAICITLSALLYVV